MKSWTSDRSKARPSSEPTKSPAVFLDRDGTIIEDSGYISDPGSVRLIPGAAEAIRRIAQAGYLVVVVSNQSGVARGLFDETALSRVHSRVEALLAAQGARLDGVYYCPFLNGPEAQIEAYRRDSDLRKPRPGMLREAAVEMGIDLTRSWMIGDKASDITAGQDAGCRTVFLARNASDDDQSVAATHRVGSLHEAAELIETAPKIDQQATLATSTPTPEADVRMVQVLEGIQQQVDRIQRHGYQQDFSILRLVGALLQMLAIVAALWGAGAAFADDPASATARFTLACFLQLASITTFLFDRIR